MTKNRLSRETSPYLLQHRDNPVHWYPWGNDAFQDAHAQNKPILLSVGYAACHWCHVMAHESFEDQDTAKIMNTHFVNIKMDREEFPDIDKIYMDSLHLFGEHGGWPLTMFLTPDAVPFWGGTYYPKTSSYGRPGFSDMLLSVSATWKQHPDQINKNSTAIRKALKAAAKPSPTDEQLSIETLKQTAVEILNSTDRHFGGLAGAPKFPQTMMYRFLWEMSLISHNIEFESAVLTSLTHMCQGGIYDHLGGGFSRYSVDEKWLAPHFEKMLYDNALLIELLSIAFAKTGNELFRIRIKETVNWLVKDMLTDDDVFAASYDADSEGEEGTFYVWPYSELQQVIPQANQKTFFASYDVTSSGNWEGKTILNRLNHIELDKQEVEQSFSETRKTLLEHRSKRQKPGWDDKVLTDWNALTIKALITASLALDNSDWANIAIKAYGRLLRLLLKPDGLFHSYRAGKTTNPATADDYANLISAALCLFEFSANNSYLNDAIDLYDQINAFHWSRDHEGYYFSSSRSKHLLERSLYAHDDATPNANATMVTNLVKLHLLTGIPEFEHRAERLIKTFTGRILSSQISHAGIQQGFLDLSQSILVVIVLPQADQSSRSKYLSMIKAIQPRATALITPENQSATFPDPLAGKICNSSKPTLYICKGKTCSSPITEITTENILNQINQNNV